MAKKRDASEPPATKTVPAGNRTFKAQLVFRSGAVVDLSFAASESNAFDVILSAHLTYLSDPNKKFGFYTVGTNGVISIDWREVAAFNVLAPV